MVEGNNSIKCNSKIGAKLQIINQKLNKVISLTMISECALENQQCPTERLVDLMEIASCQLFDIKDEINNLIETA